MTYFEAYEQFNALFENQLSVEDAKHFLVELYERGESFEEIAAAARVMREHSVTLDIPATLKEEILDIVGTGGDKSGTFNISTTTSIVLASLGCKVAKHGSGSATSLSGSADVLKALGLNLMLSPEKQVKMLEECGFVFMFAMNHHPCMKHIMPIRKMLPHRTIFNMLGPLANPSRAKNMVVGVYDAALTEKIALAMSRLGVERAFVVSGKDNMDEITTTTETVISEIKDGKVNTFTITPEQFGLKRASLEELRGGDGTENAVITKKILSGEEKGAKRDIVLLNAGATLYVGGAASTIEDGITLAKEAIDSGKATGKLAELVKVSNEA